jgi:hypothetical protein
MILSSWGHLHRTLCWSHVIPHKLGQLKLGILRRNVISQICHIYQTLWPFSIHLNVTPPDHFLTSGLMHFAALDVRVCWETETRDSLSLCRIAASLIGPVMSHSGRRMWYWLTQLMLFLSFLTMFSFNSEVDQLLIICWRTIKPHVLISHHVAVICTILLISATHMTSIVGSGEGNPMRRSTSEPIPTAHVAQHAAKSLSSQTDRYFTISADVTGKSDYNKPCGLYRIFNNRTKWSRLHKIRRCEHSRSETATQQTLR